MFLDNRKNFEDNFLCIRTLVIQNDGEYGFHVYAKHGYCNIEVSFYTESEDLTVIINELNNILKNKEKSDLI